MKRSPAPIIAVLLLLLSVLYVGSYLALVVPGGIIVRSIQHGQSIEFATGEHYRWKPSLAKPVFWPLEQLDRRLRPGAWNNPWIIDEEDNVISPVRRISRRGPA